MKKLFYLFLLLSAISFIGCSNKEETDLQVDNLKGKIKSVKISRYYAKMKFGELQKDDYIPDHYIENIPPMKYPIREYRMAYDFGSVAEISYNESGYIENVYCYDDDLDVIFKFLCSWNDNKLMKCTEYNYSGDINCNIENVYEGDLLVKTVMYFKNFSAFYKFVNNQYNLDLNQLDWDYYNWYDLEINCVLKNKYDSDEILKEQILYNEDGEVAKWDYKIDGKKITKILYSTVDNSDSYVITFEYKGNLLVKQIIRNNDNDKEEIITYDEKGRRLRISTDEDNYNFTYNGNGDIDKVECNKEYYKFEYEYDDHYNWIKRISYKGIKAVSIEEREIIYY